MEKELKTFTIFLSTGQSFDVKAQELKKYKEEKTNKITFGLSGTTTEYAVGEGTNIVAIVEKV